MDAQGQPDLSSFGRNIKNRREFLKALRRLCPAKGSGISAVTLSSAEGESVTLTSETRQQIDEALRAMSDE